MAFLDKWNLLKEVCADPHVNASGRRIMVFLLDRENSRTKALFPSHSRIATDSNLHERSVIRGLNSLIACGYLRILEKGKPGRSTRYEIVMTKLSKDKKKVMTKLSQISPQYCHTNPVINPLIKKSINNIVKNSHAGYKKVKEGKQLRYNDPKMIAQRILQKTDDPLKAEAFLKLYNSFDEKEKKRAEHYARQLGCLT